jgi:hypothetical protein
MGHLYRNDQELGLYSSTHAAGAFTLFGAYTMALWAKKKQGQLIKAFKDDEKLVEQFKKKSLLFPGIY